MFNGSFKENIKYNMENVSDDDIMDASIKANALSFITGTEQTER